MPSVCEHLVSLIQGLGFGLLEAEVASDHRCVVLRAAETAPGVHACVHVGWAGSGIITQELYKQTCTCLWQVFHKAQGQVLTVFNY